MAGTHRPMGFECKTFPYYLNSLTQRKLLVNFGQRWFQLLVSSVGNRSVKSAKQVPEGSSAYSRIHTRSTRWCVLQSWLDVMQHRWHRWFVASQRWLVCACVSHLAFCLTGTAEGWPTCCLRRHFRSAMSRMLIPVVCSCFPGRLFVGILGLRRRGEKRRGCQSAYGWEAGWLS